MPLSPRNEDRLVFYGLLVLTIIIYMTFILTTPADAAIDPFGTEANSDLLEPMAYEPTDWSLLVSEYWTGADFDRAMSIMACESGGDPNAVSPTNDHGLFQHNARYAPPRFEAVGYTWSDRYDPEANIAAAHWLWERDGWQPWTCARIARTRDYFEPVTIDLTDLVGPGHPTR